jgi:hypothetical protein
MVRIVRSMSDYTFTIPDAPGTQVAVQTSIWKVPQIFHDGQLLPRQRRGGPFVLALADGTQRILRVRGTLNLSIEVDGHKFPLERRLTTFEYVFVALPAVLAIPGFTGGALGFALGIAGVLNNIRLARRDAPAIVRIVTLIAATIGYIAIYFALAAIIVFILDR